MSAVRDQRAVVMNCLRNEIPVFVLRGNDSCVMKALEAYRKEAERIGCSVDFLNEFDSEVLPDFRDYQADNASMVSLPN